MPDDRTKRGAADRARVSVCEEWEVRSWSDKFGCTERELREAVEEVGPMARDVERYLDEKRSSA